MIDYSCCGYYRCQPPDKFPPQTTCHFGVISSVTQHRFWVLSGTSEGRNYWPFLKAVVSSLSHRKFSSQILCLYVRARKVHPLTRIFLFCPSKRTSRHFVSAYDRSQFFPPRLFLHSEIPEVSLNLSLYFNYIMSSFHLSHRRLFS